MKKIGREKIITGLTVFVMFLTVIFIYQKKYSNRLVFSSTTPGAIQVSKDPGNTKKPFRVLSGSKMPVLSYSQVKVAYCPAIYKLTEGLVIQVEGSRKVTHAKYLDPNTSKKLPDGISDCVILSRAKGLKEFITILPALAKN